VNPCVISRSWRSSSSYSLASGLWQACLSSRHSLAAGPPHTWSTAISGSYRIRTADGGPVA